MQFKTFKFKLYKHKRNKYLHQQIDIAGCIYNKCIVLHKRYYRLYGKFLSEYQLNKHLTKIKKLEKYNFWSLLPAQSIGMITNRIDKGYKQFFRDIKNKSTKNSRPPSFKKVKKYKSFTLRRSCWGIYGNKIRLGNKLMSRHYGYHKSREIEGKVKAITVKRDSLGDIYVFFACEVEDHEGLPMTGKIAGFDFGLKTFLTSNDNESIESPFFLNARINELRRKSKALSGKALRSKNFYRSKSEVALCQKSIANRRKDYHFKLAKSLCERYDVMIFEDLCLEGMIKLWGRKVLDLGFYNFLCILKHQAIKYGKTVHFIDRFYPSSKTCSGCLHKKESLLLSERTFNCESCGLIIDRDLNAAINIKRVGASTLGLDTVNPKTALG